jgi:transcriptional regulator with XRE-family HTH domain
MDKSKDIQVELGKKIRQLREERGYSQESFAQECGLDRTYISGIERGKRNVSIQNIHVIASTLGIKISELFDNI